MPANQNIDSRFQVGFYNDPPTITNATVATGSIFNIGVETGKIVDINPNILISLRWAPNQLQSPDSLFEDVYGDNYDILWESGLIADPQGDKVSFKQTKDTYFCQSEMTKDGRVLIRMTKQMQAKFTGITRLSFTLTDNGKPASSSSTYDVTIAISLNPATKVPLKKPMKADEEPEPVEVEPE